MACTVLHTATKDCSSAASLSWDWDDMQLAMQPMDDGVGAGTFVGSNMQLGNRI
jgi:hypothetical protein